MPGSVLVQVLCMFACVLVFIGKTSSFILKRQKLFFSRPPDHTGILLNGNRLVPNDKVALSRNVFFAELCIDSCVQLHKAVFL